MTTQLPTTPEQLARLRCVMHDTEAHRERAFAPFGLTTTDAAVLDVLSDGPDRMSDVAESAHLSRSGLTRAVDKLERLGLVSRAGLEADRRGVEVRLTGYGSRTAVQLAEVTREALTELGAAS